ncbi:MAG: aldo/keto reductase, partial [Chloroflexi bacterium]|nr:aldo/keto reductase [Chloroflexota bacterium]
ELVNKGLVRQVGVSNFGLGRWRRAERALGSAVISNQVHYHLLKRKAADMLFPYAREKGRTVIAYSPLAQGVLAGRYGPGEAPGGVRARNVLFTPRNLRRLGPFMEVLRSVAGAHGATPAQIALAWLVHDPQVIAIPGAKSVQQVEENAAAADIALSDLEWARLGDAAQAFRRTPFMSAVPGMIARYLRP